MRPPGTIVALVDGEPVRYRAIVHEYVGAPSRKLPGSATAACGWTARALVLWREDRGRDATYITVHGQYPPLPASPGHADGCSPPPSGATPLPPHAALHDLDDDAAWVSVAGEARVGEGVVDATQSGCDTTAVWNHVEGVRALCVPTVHAVSGRFELAHTGALWSAAQPEGGLPSALRERLARLLGRRREVRILAATVPGLRFTRDCPGQEEPDLRHGWGCTGFTFRDAPRSSRPR